jgi:hypothetical protein
MTMDMQSVVGAAPIAWIVHPAVLSISALPQLFRRTMSMLSTTPSTVDTILWRKLESVSVSVRACWIGVPVFGRYFGHWPIGVRVHRICTNNIGHRHYIDSAVLMTTRHRLVPICVNCYYITCNPSTWYLLDCCVIRCTSWEKNVTSNFNLQAYRKRDQSHPKHLSSIHIASMCSCRWCCVSSPSFTFETTNRTIMGSVGWLSTFTCSLIYRLVEEHRSTTGSCCRASLRFFGGGGSFKLCIVSVLNNDDPIVEHKHNPQLHRYYK